MSEWPTVEPEGRDPFDAFVAGFKMRHEWPAESPVDLLDLAAAVHATRSLQHKADVEPLRCGTCRDDALAILIALGDRER